MKVPSLDDETWEDTLDGFDGLTVVKFFAPWCRTCRATGPTYDKMASLLEEKSPGKIQFFEVDFKKQKMLCLQQRVYQLPSVHFYTKGLGRVNRFVITTSNAKRKLETEVGRFMGDSGHLNLLQSVRTAALGSMVRYATLVNVISALAEAPKYTETEPADGKPDMIGDYVRGDDERREGLERLFATLDTNANGVLDNEEVEAIMRAIGVGDEEKVASVSASAGEIRLDREAFVQLMTNKAKLDFTTPEKELLPAFESLDVDGDGVLTREEVLNALQRMPGNSTDRLESEQAFDALDIDKSGTLDYEEFVAFMSGSHQQLAEFEATQPS